VFGEASQYLGIKPQRLRHFCFWSKNLSSVSTIKFYLFVSRHEVHSMNTHTLQNAGW